MKEDHGEEIMEQSIIQNQGNNSDRQTLDLSAKILEVIENTFKDEEFGFEAYVTMKNGDPMKHFILNQGRPEDRKDPEKNFKRKMQQAMVSEVKVKFLAENVEYDTAINIADNQNKFYVIEQDEDYKPFSMTQMSPEELDALPNYSADELENVEGMLFCFFRDGVSVWAYQFMYPNAFPNRKGLGFNLFQQGDVFVEMKKPMLFISRRIDILIIGKKVITNNTNMLQRNFGFEEFVRIKAEHAVTSVNELNLVSNSDKLTAYIQRSKPLYARKMMRIKDSRVLKKSSEELLLSVTTLPRWKGKFEVDKTNKKIVLNTFGQVENLIDLLDERYTRSDVTNEEYDTGVKKWIAPVE
ncbi:MAG: DUF4868 domain-containing protein [Clostridia bacterium]|nr:DUF4868 domain-containing protein [Clostridia bacterium]